MEKIRGFADKKSINEIKDWEIDFEKSHDGTIATHGDFYSYITDHKVIENIVCHGYLLKPLYYKPSYATIIR